MSIKSCFYTGLRPQFYLGVTPNGYVYKNFNFYEDRGLGVTFFAGLVEDIGIGIAYSPIDISDIYTYSCIPKNNLPHDKHSDCDA